GNPVLCPQALAEGVSHPPVGDDLATSYQEERDCTGDSVTTAKAALPNIAVEETKYVRSAAPAFNSMRAIRQHTSPTRQRGREAGSNLSPSLARRASDGARPRWRVGLVTALALAGASG